MFYSGCILIATPSLNDSLFERSVVLICEHDAKGAMGLIINKESPIRVRELRDIIPSFKASKKAFLVGGPVSPDEILVLHSIQHIDQSKKILDENLFLTAHIKFLTEGQESIQKQNFMELFLGYSSWVSGQLEAEIERGSWVTSPYDHKMLWSTPMDRRWNKVMHNLGEDFACVAYRPIDAEMN